jgi:predicted ATPase
MAGMEFGLQCLEIANYRCLRHVKLETGPVNVFFGPNGAGKSALLDTLWMVRDCAINGVDKASGNRSHGIGMRWDKAPEDEPVSVMIETVGARYQVTLGISSGKIEPFAGERLHAKHEDIELIKRSAGTDAAGFFHRGLSEVGTFPLREPEKLALSRYVLFEDGFAAAHEVDRLLHGVNFYHLRSLDLYGLKTRGSESSYQTRLWDRGQNLWSVLRNLHDKRELDSRYDTVMEFMKKSFPSFSGIILEQTGPSSVYGSFRDKLREQPILASGISDGHLMMLALLTALFSEGKDRDALIMFDEPETSLHPHALAVFAEAVSFAAAEWRKQVFLATHSPVLLSQFEPDQIIAVNPGLEGETTVKRVREIEGIQDLLEEYALGSLYMAEAIAPQSGAAVIEEPS